jgi:hypothetical protein
MSQAEKYSFTLAKHLQFTIRHSAKLLQPKKSPVVQLIGRKTNSELHGKKLTVLFDKKWEEGCITTKRKLYRVPRRAAMGACNPLPLGLQRSGGWIQNQTRGVVTERRWWRSLGAVVGAAPPPWAAD